MNSFFKKDLKPKPVQVMIFNGYVDDDCTDFANWIFDLPHELCVEMMKKYKLPKYLGVTIGDQKEILLLDVDSIHIEYNLSSYNPNWLDRGDYDGVDFRTAKDYDSKESVYLHWGYQCMDDEGDFDVWEGYVGDKYSQVFDCKCYDTVYPSIEITGEDREKLLAILYDIMIGIIDGPPEGRDIYDYCGD